MGDVQVSEIDAMGGRHSRASERDDDVSHHEADDHTKNDAPDENVSRKKSKLERGKREKRAPDEADDEMQQAAEQCDADSGAKRGRAEEVGGVPLEKDERRGAMHDERFGDPKIEVYEDGAGDAREEGSLEQ